MKIFGLLQGTESLNLPPGNSCLQQLRRTRDKIEAEKKRLKSTDDKTAETGAALAAVAGGNPAVSTVSFRVHSH